MSKSIKITITAVSALLIFVIAIAGYLIPAFTGFWSDNMLLSAFKQATHWNMKSLANSGDVYSQELLGWHYLSSPNYDFDEAVKWLELSAAQGNQEVMESLALMFCNSTESEAHIDMERAVEWAIRAAEQSVETGVKFNWSGSIPSYWHGNNLFDRGEYSEAIFEFAHAAGEALPWGMNCLGTCYELGVGVEQDNRKALYWYAKAAKRGLPQGQFNLGLAYFKGEIIEEDLYEAVYYFLLAAEQGNASAQYYLGFCYQNGYGVKQNYEQAVYWYRRSAKQGNAFAQNNLETLLQIKE